MVFDLYSQSHFRNIIILILSSIVWKCLLVLLLHTGGYLRKFDSYKHLILFTIGILTVVPGKMPLNFKIKNACLEKGRGEGILFPSLLSFLLIYLPCPPLKGDARILFFLIHLIPRCISDLICYLLPFQTPVHIDLPLLCIPIAITLQLGMYKMITWRSLERW